MILAVVGIILTVACIVVGIYALWIGYLFARLLLRAIQDG